jgi:hypothetical protein
MQDHATRAARGQRIDAQPEVFTGRLLEQGGIDAAADHFLEDFLAFRLFDRHGFAQLAIDVQREAVDRLPVVV